jgi:hypothetical protein
MAPSAVGRAEEQTVDAMQPLKITGRRGKIKCMKQLDRRRALNSLMKLLHMQDRLLGLGTVLVCLDSKKSNILAYAFTGTMVAVANALPGMLNIDSHT